MGWPHGSMGAMSGPCRGYAGEIHRRWPVVGFSRGWPPCTGRGAEAKRGQRRPGKRKPRRGVNHAGADRWGWAYGKPGQLFVTSHAVAAMTQIMRRSSMVQSSISAAMAFTSARLAISSATSFSTAGRNFASFLTNTPSRYADNSSPFKPFSLSGLFARTSFRT